MRPRGVSAPRRLCRGHFESLLTRPISRSLLRADRSLALVAHALRAVRRSVKRWRMPAIDVSEWPALLMDNYRASRKAMRRAQKRTSPAELHRWRKRVKTLWYQVRVAESLAPGVHREIRRFEQLETWLGEHHNLSVLQTTIADDVGLRRMPADVHELAAMSSAVQTEFQRKTFTLGERLLADKPKVFARRLRRAFTPPPNRNRGGLSQFVADRRGQSRRRSTRGT